jgi:hypothetical protein
MILLLMAAAITDPLVGEWRGTSICQVRPSPCNDEQAVYTIERTRNGTYLVHFAKPVGGQPAEFDAALGRFDPTTRTLTVHAHGRRGDFTWRFHLENDRLTGDLITPHSTVYRKADVKRVAS